MFKTKHKQYSILIILAFLLVGFSGVNNAAAQTSGVRPNFGGLYAYDIAEPGQGGGYYRDDYQIHGVHAVHTDGFGVFDNGDLTDGAIQGGGILSQSPVITIYGSASDITFDLVSSSVVDEVVIGTHVYTPYDNQAPDDVTIYFSDTGTALGDFGAGYYFNLLALYGPLENGHHDMALSIPNVSARYVKLSFDGGTMTNSNVNDPNAKYMLDEVSIYGSSGPVTPTPTPEPQMDCVSLRASDPTVVFCEDFNDGSISDGSPNFWREDFERNTILNGQFHSDGTDHDGSDRVWSIYNVLNLSIPADGYIELSYIGKLKSPGNWQNGRGILVVIAGKTDTGDTARIDLNIQNGYVNGFPTDQQSLSIAHANQSVNSGTLYNLISTDDPPAFNQFYAIRAVRENGFWTLFVGEDEIGTVAEPFHLQEITQIHMPLVGSVVVDSIVVRTEASTEPPVVDAGGHYSGNEGSSIVLNQAAVTDLDGDSLTYAWTTTSTVCPFVDPTLLHATVTCTDDGDFEVTLEVSDGVYDPVPDTAELNVANVPPTAEFNMVPDAILITQLSVATFSNQFDPSTVDTTSGFTYEYDCDNDGLYEVTSIFPTHSCTFYVPGMHTVNGKISDELDGTLYLADILVQTPAERCNDIAEELEDYPLPNSSGYPLAIACDKLSDKNPKNDKAAVGAMEATIQQIESQAGKKLSQEEADYLIGLIEEVLAILNQ